MGASKAIAFNEHSPSEPAFAGFFFVKKPAVFAEGPEPVFHQRIGIS